MSHTTTLPAGWIAIHNGLVEDDDVITLRKLAGAEPDRVVMAEINVPYKVVKEFVAHVVRADAIAALECASASQLLTIFTPPPST